VCIIFSSPKATGSVITATVAIAGTAKDNAITATIKNTKNRFFTSITPNLLIVN
jgi:uncharacterized membrane protein